MIAVSRPEDYDTVLGELRATGEVSVETRRAFAARAFATTSAYDSAVTTWLSRDDRFPDTLVPVFDHELDLSYGENPHQRAAYYAERGARTHLLARVEQLHGKPLSFNNLNDLSAARLLALELEGPACVIVKHANPCGVGVADDDRGGLREGARRRPGLGVRRRRRPDARRSARRSARRLAEQFIEVLFAPGYDAAAIEALVQKPETRILNNQERRGFVTSELDLKRVLGGMLAQDRDGEPDPLDEMDVICGVMWRREPGRISCSPGPSSSTSRRTRSCSRVAARRSGSAPAR